MSEPIRGMYKCYQHLHIMIYSSGPAPNIDTNRQRVGFCLLAFPLWNSSMLKLLSMGLMTAREKQNAEKRLGGFRL